MKTKRNLTYVPITVIATMLLSSIISHSGPLSKSNAQLDKKIGGAQERIEKLQAKPKKAIPAAVLANARGIIILKNIKAGLGIGGSVGGGVAMVKEKGTDNWKAPVFVRAAEASWGLQIGAQGSDIIILLMNEKSLDFLKPLGSTGAGFAADASVGPVDIGEKFDTDTLKSHVLVYSDSSGAFAGAIVKAGGLIGSKGNNMNYYGASMQDILFGKKGQVTPQGQKLIDSIQKYAGKAKSAGKATTAAE